MLELSKIEKVRLPQTMKNSPHARILDAYFWLFVDRGDSPQATPLFTGIHQGESLSLVVARESDLSSREAESAIEIAREEVTL
jgi:hypothetical protein